MKIFLGTDICEIERIEKAYNKYEAKFLARTYTQSEIDYCLSLPKLTAERLAVRFATKEAVSKALGVGINKLGWDKGINLKDVEILRNSNGSIRLKLYNKALVLEKQFGITEWAVSVSHSKKDAISTVIGT